MCVSPPPLPVDQLMSGLVCFGFCAVSQPPLPEEEPPSKSHSRDDSCGLKDELVLVSPSNDDDPLMFRTAKANKKMLRYLLEERITGDAWVEGAAAVMDFKAS